MMVYDIKRTYNEEFYFPSNEIVSPPALMGEARPPAFVPLSKLWCGHNYLDTSTCAVFGRELELWSTDKCIKSPFPQVFFDSHNSTMKMKGIFMIVLVLAAGFSCSGATITADTVSAAYDELQTFMKANSKYLGRMVRLSKYIQLSKNKGKFTTKNLNAISVFHDCVSDACDGCINTSQDANQGLSDVQEDFAEMFDTYNALGMSRADFWALASIAAAELGAIKGGTSLPELVFRAGRVDCSESPDDSQEFEYPEADMDHDTMFAYFESHFGYNANQTVALMGAHALGVMHRGTSGYSGTFTNGAVKKLNNQYFSDMFDSSDWTESSVTTKRVTKWQWDSISEAGARLHTDFECLYKITVDSDSGAPTCTLDQCGHSDTYDLSALYATVSTYLV